VSRHAAHQIWPADRRSFDSRLVALGTALAKAGSAYVQGLEHVVEELVADVCAACVIRDAFGNVAGTFDLTCEVEDANGLLLTIAKQTARSISAALLADYRPVG
jgi:transcriptional regulator of acetoin/glycerol metabolism